MRYVLVLALAVGPVACSSPPTVPPTDSAATDTSTSGTDATTGTDTAPASDVAPGTDTGSPGADASGPDSAPADTGFTGRPGEAYCRPASPAPTCDSTEMLSCGACVAPPMPAAPMQRTACSALRYREFCDPAATPSAPNLGCYLNYNPAMPPTSPPSMTVTVWGVVDVFGTGPNSDQVVVTIYRVNADGTLGGMVGTATSDTTGTRFNYTEMENVETDSGMISQTRTLGGFKIDGVPTETPLVIKTQGPTDTFGHAIYDYTIPIRNADVNTPAPPAGLAITTPAVRIRPRALSNSDWRNIPTTATLVGGIPMGHGALAGEVHDCDDVRLNNVMLNSNPETDIGTVYFTDNDTNPVPTSSRALAGTGALGIYAMLDLLPGPVTVSSLGYTSTNTLVHVGSYRAQIFADSVTVVTLRGIRPWQVAP